MFVLLDRDWRGHPLDGPHPRVELTKERGEVRVAVDAPFWGDPAPQAPAGRLWGLWEYEVVEIFIAGVGPRYLELELGPHGHHLFLGLAGVRRIADDALPLASYQLDVQAERWHAVATFAAALLPEGPLRYNVCTIRGQGEREYRSLVALPGDTPDFHQPQAFLPWPNPAK
jgi:hypothetical protein